MKKYPIFFVLLLLLLLPTCLIAAPVPEFDFTPEFLDRAEILAAAESVTAKAYPDADTVLINGGLWIRYRPDGTFIQWDEKYTRIMTEKGRRKFRTVSSYFTIPYQRGEVDCRIPVLEVIKPDGTVIPVDVENQSKVMVNPDSMQSNIYNPDSKVIRVNVSGLEVGDIIHWVMYDRIVKPKVPDSWYDWLTFESTMPIRRSAVTIIAPETMPLRSIALKGEIAGTIVRRETEDDGLITYQWEAWNVPRFFPEPNMPSPRTVSQRLLVSTLPDWESVSRWYWELSKPHLTVTPEITAKVADLIAGREDSREKIKAIFRFVSQKIRYLGIISESEAPGYEPHDVKDTFEARHGVCRDKAALLASMLRSAGFDAYPTLIYTGPRKDPEVPQPYFNHAITAIRQDDGSFILMDSTDETTAELLPSYLDDKSYLVATPAGEGLRTSPIDPAGNNLMRVDTVGSIDQSGNLSAETVFHFDGINDNAYRRSFARKKPEERRRFFEGLMKKAGVSARVEEVDIEPADLMDTTVPLTARVKYQADDVIIQGENAALLSLPSIGLRVGVVNFILGKTGLKERRFPLRTKIACGIRERIELDIDPSLGETVYMPEGEALDNETLFWSFGTQRSGSVLEYETDFRLKAVEFSPSDYLRLKETLKQIERELRRMPIFSVTEKPGPREETSAADIEVLEDRTDFILNDRHSWTRTRTIRKEILTYSGKKQSGELKFEYNPAREEVALDEARVINPDGTVTEVSRGEINLMDAPWVGSAPRYPGGKILVVSLPRLEIGSIIEYRCTTTYRDYPFFFAYITFRSYDAIKKKIVTLEAPAELSLTIFPDEIANIIRETSLQGEDDSRVLYRWLAEDIPPLQREKRIPPRWSFLPTLFLSCGEWRTYAGEVNDILTTAASDQPESERKARLLVEGESDPWKKLASIRDFIAINVRKAGPGIDALPLTAVTGADRTLKDGYGNTTDRAVLYYTMLKEAGFSPEFVLASPRPMITEFAELYRKVPNADSFPEVLVRVVDASLSLEDGRAVYLNDTDQYAVLGATLHEGKMGINMPEGRLEEIRPSLETSTDFRIGMKVSEDGDLFLSVKRMLRGNTYGKKKKFFAELTPEKKRRYYQELLGGYSKAARAQGELTTDFSGYPGRIEFSLEIPDYAVLAGEYLYFFHPPSAPVFELSSDSRLSPLYFKKKLHKNSETIIEFPPGFTVDYMPAPIKGEEVVGTDLNIDFSFQLESEGDNLPDRIIIRADQALDPSIIAPARYRELLDLYRKLINRNFRLFLLRRISGEED